ncbi:MAG TPA: glycosyl hydrolase family 65 protein, partial [Lacipirellulaceae bacterium]|nr:glycosyl hydrolase family 65 protein [Lacipirellulaceae bacterium]
DYGFTFLNCEAVAFGIATPEQANSIHAWLDGERKVAGDTSTGDIYHWRFGPRSTTRRNLDYYFWGWSNPESVPWGNQVQDGGAVLAWSYYDLMARLKTAGPDDAAARLSAMATWFDETQREGGYRKYYGKDATRGTLQGGNVAGGLGLDSEFVESVLAPQVMLYGFLGFRPTVDGFAIAPQLPKDWPALTVTRIHLHDEVLDVTMDQEGRLKISGTSPNSEELVVHGPAGLQVSAPHELKVRFVGDLGDRESKTN